MSEHFYRFSGMRTMHLSGNMLFAPVKAKSGLITGFRTLDTKTGSEGSVDVRLPESASGLFVWPNSAHNRLVFLRRGGEAPVVYTVSG